MHFHEDDAQLQQFIRDMRSVGHTIETYRAPNGYVGPAVRIGRSELCETVTATRVRLRTVPMRAGLVVYPA